MRRDGGKLQPSRLLIRSASDAYFSQQLRFLNGAACHGCLLLAETSCERRNEFLDRTLVIPTVESLDAEFFREEA